MKKVLMAILIVLLLGFYGLVGWIFFPWHSDQPIDSFADQRVEVLRKSYELVDTKEKIVITNRVLAVQDFSNQIYALSYDGFLIYDLKNGSVKLYKGEYDGLQGIDSTKKHEENQKYKDYRQPTSVVEISSYDDFTTEEKNNFDEMLSNRKNSSLRTSFYITPFYEAAYNNALIDVKHLVQLTVCDRYSIQGDKIYIYGGNNFTLLNSSTGKILQYYNDNLGVGEAAQEEIKKKIYGDQITFLSSPKEFSAEDLIIFKVLRELGLKKGYGSPAEDVDKYLSVDLMKL